MGFVKLRNQLDDEKSMKGRKVKGEKVVQVVARCALYCGVLEVYMK